MLLKKISDVRADQKISTTYSLNVPRNRQVTVSLWIRCLSIPISKVPKTWKTSGYKPMMRTYSGNDRMLDSLRSMALMTYWTHVPVRLQHKLPRRQPPPLMNLNKMTQVALHSNRTIKQPTIMKPVPVQLHQRSKTLRPTQLKPQRKSPLPLSIHPLPQTQPQTSKTSSKRSRSRSEYNWFRSSVHNLTAIKHLTKI